MPISYQDDVAGDLEHTATQYDVKKKKSKGMGIGALALPLTVHISCKIIYVFIFPPANFHMHVLLQGPSYKGAGWGVPCTGTCQVLVME